jgi:glycerol-3-phosphate acyltransferase PlsY
MTSTAIAARISIPFIAYLLGSIPWGIVIAPFFTSRDIRKQGSGNIGATNVRRIAGSKAGALVLTGDILKGVLPVYMAMRLVNIAHPLGQLYIAIIALAAFLGHLYPLYLGCKDGGKGVATALGCILVISPFTAVITVLVFVLMVCISNRVSVASLSASAVLPLVMWKATAAWSLTAGAIIMTIFVFFRHKNNILRLLHGTEPAIWK